MARVRPGALHTWQACVCHCGRVTPTLWSTVNADERVAFDCTGSRRKVLEIDDDVAPCVLVARLIRGAAGRARRADGRRLGVRVVYFRILIISKRARQNAGTPPHSCNLGRPSHQRSIIRGRQLCQQSRVHLRARAPVVSVPWPGPSQRERNCTARKSHTRSRQCRVKHSSRRTFGVASPLGRASRHVAAPPHFLGRGESIIII